MTIPTKTALGNDELKSRTQGLGQRHRTILFLVDGRRPLSEVLSLAQKAGAATTHFEDLVRLGLVDVPPEPEPEPEGTPPAAEEPQDEVTALQLDVPMPPMPPDVPAWEPADAPVLTEAVMPPPPPAAPPPPMPAAVEAVEAVEAAIVPVVPPAPPPPPPPPVRREVPVLREDTAVDPLQQVRDLLIDTLRLDAPVFSARMFMRVRNAQTASELIDLVWEIQDHLNRARHAQRQLQTLQRAREILGLGNTLVAEDSTRPPPLDD